MRTKPGILFQNDTILAMDKPSGLLSVPDRYHEDKPSLTGFVMDAFPDARPLHRIDFETSGIVLFCLNPDAFGFYSEQFEHRDITKSYIVITEGRCMETSGDITAPLYTQHIGKVLISKRGKESYTHWNLLERFQHHSCIEANPRTGRTHQIRVHLASIGLPVVGDALYGSGRYLFLSDLKGKKNYRLSKNDEEERPILSRLALHAASIQFTDFTTRETISIESPLPKDMQVTLAKLRQYSSVPQ